MVSMRAPRRVRASSADQRKAGRGNKRPKRDSERPAWSRVGQSAYVPGVLSSLDSPRAIVWPCS